MVSVTHSGIFILIFATFSLTTCRIRLTTTTEDPLEQSSLFHFFQWLADPSKLELMPYEIKSNYCASFCYSLVQGISPLFPAIVSVDESTIDDVCTTVDTDFTKCNCKDPRSNRTISFWNRTCNNTIDFVKDIKCIHKAKRCKDWTKCERCAAKKCKEHFHVRECNPNYNAAEMCKTRLESDRCHEGVLKKICYDAPATLYFTIRRIEEANRNFNERDWMECRNLRKGLNDMLPSSYENHEENKESDDETIIVERNKTHDTENHAQFERMPYVLLVTVVCAGIIPILFHDRNGLFSGTPLIVLAILVCFTVFPASGFNNDTDDDIIGALDFNATAIPAIECCGDEKAAVSGLIENISDSYTICKNALKACDKCTNETYKALTDVEADFLEAACKNTPDYVRGVMCVNWQIGNDSDLIKCDEKSGGKCKRHFIVDECVKESEAEYCMLRSDALFCYEPMLRELCGEETVRIFFLMHGIKVADESGDWEECRKLRAKLDKKNERPDNSAGVPSLTAYLGVLAPMAIIFLIY